MGLNAGGRETSHQAISYHAASQGTEQEAVLEAEVGLDFDVYISDTLTTVPKCLAQGNFPL